MAEEKKPLIILAGPTAVGKTAASIGLAKALDGEIISADSMQVYRGMDIGSAKIRPEEMQGVPHHLIDVLDPTENFDVTRFQQMAKQAMSEIYGRGHIPILVGGTGFYIQSVLYDIDFTDSGAEDGYRAELEQLAAEKGAEYLHEMLRKCDPESAEAIHANNQKRVIRALEFYHQTGKPISAHNKEQKQKESPYQFCYFVLDNDRAVLYDRIDRRVDAMMKEGLLEEVRRLKEAGLKATDVSMQGLGYKELFPYLSGEGTLEDAVYTLKRDTRHFAKRQLTWFHHVRDITWIPVQNYDNDPEKIVEAMLAFCKEKGIEKRTENE